MIGDSVHMEKCIAWSVRLTECWSWLETWRIITNFQLLKDEPQIIESGAIWRWRQWWHTPKHVFSELHVRFTYYSLFYLESLPWRSIGFNIYLIFHTSNGGQPFENTEKRGERFGFELLCSSIITFMKQWRLVGTCRCHPSAWTWNSYLSSVFKVLPKFFAGTSLRCVFCWRPLLHRVPLFTSFSCLTWPSGLSCIGPLLIYRRLINLWL